MKTFAAIYIGTSEVSLKVFEISIKKKIHEIDHVRTRMELGRETYTKGSIGYELLNELCDVLHNFGEIMKGYRTEQYAVYASSVFRDAENEMFLIDQIRLRTGFLVQVISNSENRFISYKSVAGREKFEAMIQTSAAVVDIDGADLQITLFRSGRLITTQHVLLGTVQLSELLQNKSRNMEEYEKQLEEFVNKKMESIQRMYLDDSVQNVILMGDYCMELVRRLDKNPEKSQNKNPEKSLDKNPEKSLDKVLETKPEKNRIVPAKDFRSYLEHLQKSSLEEICTELNLAKDLDPLILPSVILYKAIVTALGSEKVWIPGVNINDGIAFSYAQKNHLIKDVHDFDDDIISAAMNLSRHYNSYSPHIEALSESSGKIFDSIRKVHGLGNRERILLQAAAILHDCGKFISFANSPECAYEIIMSSEIIGLTHLERKIVALTVLYNTRELPPYSEIKGEIDKESYMVVAKLSAILRVSNALDQSHMQKFGNMSISLKDRQLIFKVECYQDLSLEQALFELKTAFFENVYSIKPVLIEKRGYNSRP